MMMMDSEAFGDDRAIYFHYLDISALRNMFFSFTPLKGNAWVATMKHTFRLHTQAASKLIAHVCKKVPA